MYNTCIRIYMLRRNPETWSDHGLYKDCVRSPFPVFLNHYKICILLILSVKLSVIVPNNATVLTVSFHTESITRIVVVFRKT